MVKSSRGPRRDWESGVSDKHLGFGEVFLVTRGAEARRPARVGVKVRHGLLPIDGS